MTEPFIVAIPARHASTRLPGKPLRRIHGRPMVQWVYDCARHSGAESVVIATDHADIATCAQGFGAEVCLTASTHVSGTDRLAEVAVQKQWPDEAIVVNLQGDEPLMPPALLAQVATCLSQHPEAGLATLCTPIDSEAAWRDSSVVKVVCAADGRALYFSRAPIPHPRDAASGALPTAIPAMRHIGLYAYRVATLRRFPTLSPAPLEQTEMLEQLRALWHGIGIQVAIAQAQPGHGVDTEADLQRVTALLAAPESATGSRHHRAD